MPSDQNTYEYDPDSQPAGDVYNPRYYKAPGVSETCDVITAWGLGYALGNVVKYISRAGKKDPGTELEDLKKARWYLEHRIRQLEEDGPVKVGA